MRAGSRHLVAGRRAVLAGQTGGQLRSGSRPTRSTSRSPPTSTTRSPLACSRGRRRREGGGAYINSKAGGGGLGAEARGRLHRLAPDANDSPHATITACQNDLAVVGGAALFLSSADDTTSCKEQAGQPTGLPDIGSVITGVPRDLRPGVVPGDRRRNRLRGDGRTRSCSAGHAGPSGCCRSKGRAARPVVSGNDTEDAERRRGHPPRGRPRRRQGRQHDPGRRSRSAERVDQSRAGDEGGNSNYSLMTSAANAALELRERGCAAGARNNLQDRVGVRVVLRQQDRDRQRSRRSRVSTSSSGSCRSRRRSTTRRSPRSSSTSGRTRPTSSRRTRFPGDPHLRGRRSRPRWPRVASTASPGPRHTSPASRP